MIRPGLPVGEDDLSAYVDGRLRPERREAVEALMAERPDIAAAVIADRGAAAALRDRLRAKAEEPVPARLRVSALRARRPGGFGRVLGLALAACLCLALGGVAGWFARDLLGAGRPSGDESWAAMPREALAAHRTFAPEIVHPVEVKASEQTHLTQWLSKRLRRRLVIPDLSERFGLELVGGRLLPAGREVAAQLMYADPAGSRVTLYVRSGESGESALKYLSERDLAAVSWVNEGYGYALIGPMDRQRLQVVARAVAQDLELEAAKQRRAL